MLNIKYKLVTGLLIFSPFFFFLALKTQTYSQANVRYPNPVTCDQAVFNEIELMRSAWNDNLAALMKQEKPASRMVDEAFESMRTYRCWLDYLCEAVLFSGNADAAVLGNAKLTTVHIEPLPGCTSPDTIEIPGTQIKLIPQCKAGRENTLGITQTNYEACRKMTELEFFKPTTPDSAAVSNLKAFQNQSAAYVALERALKTKSAGQKSQILGTKLRDMVQKLQNMTSHMATLQELVKKFDDKLACLAPKTD